MGRRISAGARAAITALIIAWRRRTSRGKISEKYLRKMLLA
jgi:hypothetical protein